MILNIFIVLGKKIFQKRMFLLQAMLAKNMFLWIVLVLVLLLVLQQVMAMVIVLLVVLLLVKVTGVAQGIYE